jgi:DNA-binding response OmpR family regulator
MNRILIVEDEDRIASFLEKGLRAQGFVTMRVGDGRSAVSAARDADVDLMILDLGLPDMDGHQVLRQIRARGERMRVIILTARQVLSEKVSGLDEGADDYVTKPFAFDELLARIRARLRAVGEAKPTTLVAGDVQLDLRTHTAAVGGETIELSAREFQLAETLFRHRGQVLSREQLLSRVWGYDYDPGSNIVDVYVGYLRKKLGSDVIETVRGVGYRVALG